MAGGDNTSAFSEDRVDLRAAFFRHGRDGDEGLAAFGERAAVHEVVLAADAGDDAGADRISAYLAGEVDLDCGVDGHDRRVLRDAERIIGPRYILEQQILTTVHIVIEPARTESEGSYGDARTDLFAGVVDHAAFQKREHAVGHGFGMKSEVLMVLESGQDGIRDASDTDLQGRAVRNHLGYMASDRGINFCRNGSRNLNQRVINLYSCIDLRYMDQRITVRERHGFVDLHDDLAGTFGRGDSKVGRHSERAIAIFIRRGHIEKYGIERKGSVTEKTRDLTKESRYRGSVTVCKPATYVIGHKETLHMEGVLVLGLAVRSFAASDGKGCIYGHITKFPATVGKGLREDFRDRCTSLDINAVS